jgi:hypothetical protein
MNLYMLYKQPYSLIHIVFKIFVQEIKRMKIQKTFRAVLNCFVSWDSCFFEKVGC